LVQCLEAQAAQLHDCARCCAVEHDLLREDIEHVALRGRLEIAWGCGEMARHDHEGVI
jgi:hypothetical protein